MSTTVIMILAVAASAVFLAWLAIRQIRREIDRWILPHPNEFHFVRV
ncbi:MAG: hypothetical protein V1809_05325 [Planctomycetota bacterium]